jgi:PAS domain S-box-containing protein
VRTSIPLSALHLVLIGGVLATLALHQAFLWRRRGGGHAYSALWSVIGVVFVSARLAHRLADETAVAMVAQRVQFAAGALVVGVTMALLETTAGVRTWRRVVLHGTGLTVTAVALATPWTGAYAPSVRTDVLGQAYLVGPTTPAVIAAALHTILGAVLVTSTLRRHAVRLRGAALVLPIGFALLASNDTLAAEGLLHTVPSLEFGFLGAALAWVLLFERQFDARVDALGDTVHVRTRELAAALAEVRHGEARLRDLTEASLEGVLFHDGSHVLDSNVALERLTGLAGHELRHTPVRDLFADGPEAADLAALLAGRSDGPVALRLGGPVRRDVEVCGRRSRYDGAAVGVLTVTDVTERRALQGRLMVADRLATLGTLAAGTAHEINNPLAYVINNLEHVAASLDEQPEVDPTLRAAVADARDGAERIRGIVRDMQTLARTDRGASGTADVATTLHQVARMAATLAAHHATITVEAADGLIVRGDPGPLSQVFLNLIVNATQATRAAGRRPGRIEVRAARCADAIGVEVIDDGAGVPPEVVARVFDPFFTTKAPGEGTGLGLAICHSIITGFGGTISIDSTPGRGTAVRLRLVPAAVAAAVAPPDGAPEPERSRAVTPSSRGLLPACPVPP